MDKIKVFEAFSGYGSQSMALRNLGIDYEVVAISEIDKYAIQAYQAVHGDVLNLGDISKINIENIPQHDLFTYSFPCQDISIAGKQEGIEKGKTRSGLLYECEKIIEHCKPKYLLMENVKNLVGKKFKPQFNEWLAYLETLGYTNYWQVLNAKDYGVPQNRERVFVVSILGEHKPYEFPKPIVLTTRIKDILEPVVDEKYYINKHLDIMSRNKNIKISKVESDSYILEPKIICHKVPQYVEVRVNKVDVEGLKSTLRTAKDITKLTMNEISNTLNIDKTTVEHWFRNDNCFSIPSREIWMDLKKVLNINTNKFDKSIMEFEIREGKFDTATRVYDSNGIAPTLTCDSEHTAKKIVEYKNLNSQLVATNIRLRKLTPREAFRLMNVSDDDIDKIQASGISNTQQYKMAGNSIVVNVLEGIFRQLFLVEG